MYQATRRQGERRRKVTQISIEENSPKEKPARNCINDILKAVNYLLIGAVFKRTAKLGVMVHSEYNDQY